MKLSTHLALSALVALSLACSAHAGGGPGPGPGDPDASSTGPDGSTSGTVSFTCAQLCERLASDPSCGAAGASACMSSCDASIRSTPSACVASANALYACTRTASIRCVSGTTFPFPDCMSQYLAYASCVTSAPPPRDGGVTPPSDGGVTPPRDGGVTPPIDGGGGDPCVDARDCASCTGRSQCGWCANRCWVGSSSGPTGGSCGGTTWAWTSGMCSSTPPPDAGGGPSAMCQSCAFGACGDELNACVSNPTCASCVSNPTSPACASNAEARALITCVCSSCSSACAGYCG